MQKKKAYQPKMEVQMQERRQPVGSTNYLTNLSKGLAVSGLSDTVEALNEGRVHRLIVCASLPLSAGWQCHECQALYPEVEIKPKQCLYCASARFHIADLKSELIARAYQNGCSIEVMSRCPELERVGGIGALLHERYS